MPSLWPGGCRNKSAPPVKIGDHPSGITMPVQSSHFTNAQLLVRSENGKYQSRIPGFDGVKWRRSGAGSGQTPLGMHRIRIGIGGELSRVPFSWASTDGRDLYPQHWQQPIPIGDWILAYG